MSPSRGVAVRCPGKVNLHLEVLGRRGDGYHELRTLFAAVGVWDELDLTSEASGDLTLDVLPRGALPASADNLVLRAASAARRSWHVADGARIVLRKAIPIAGGMGGGSADAAATLVALAALWRRPQTDEALRELAAELGSDVPYFLVGGAAWGEGRGERVRPVPDLPPWYLLLLPGEEPVSTAQVYRSLELESGPRSPATAVYDWLAGGGEVPLSAFRNDLEPTVIAHWPKVRHRLDLLRATKPLLAMVSGSGGTVFAAYADATRARSEAAKLARFSPIVAPLLTRERSALRPTVLEER